MVMLLPTRALVLRMASELTVEVVIDFLHRQLQREPIGD